MHFHRGCWVALLALMFTTPSSAQFYPGPMMGGGWGGFGSAGRDPGADFMRGVGYYRKAQADSAVKDAEASKIRAEAFVKWNAAMSEARKAKEVRDAQQAARDQVETAIRNRAALVESGTILNEKLEQIYDFPVDGTGSSLAQIALQAEVLREIPFENASEPVTACLNLLTQQDGWPAMLSDSKFDEPRQAFSSAVSEALKEDLNGSISDETRAKLDTALSDLRSALKTHQGGFAAIGTEDADQFLRTMAGMIRLLEAPQGGAVYRMIETYDQGTMADLVGFMHAYNLRFGRANTDRQKEIYRQLDEMLGKVPAEAPGSADVATKPLIESSKLVGDSAKEIFSNLSWDDLDSASGS